jgi:hypothetical protein
MYYVVAVIIIIAVLLMFRSSEYATDYTQQVINAINNTSTIHEFRDVLGKPNFSLKAYSILILYKADNILSHDNVLKILDIL